MNSSLILLFLYKITKKEYQHTSKKIYFSVCKRLRREETRV